MDERDSGATVLGLNGVNIGIDKKGIHIAPM